MADDKKKEAAEGEEPKKKGPLLWIILAIVLALAGVGGGVFLGPMIMKPPPAAGGEAKAEAAAEAPKQELPPIVVPWPPLVVDVPDERGGSRHVKLVITLETVNEQLEAELSAFAPRGRQAALGFVRAQSYENLTDPSKFESLQKKMTEVVRASVGKSSKGEERVSQVLITDLVAQ